MRKELPLNWRKIMFFFTAYLQKSSIKPVFETTCMKDVVRNQCHLNFCAILVSKWESSICGRILMSCPVVTLWFGLLTKGGVTIITSLPHHHHHHVDILTSGGDSMWHVEGKVEVRFVEFKYRDDIHILLVTSWLRKQRRDIRKTRKMAWSISTKN